MQKVHWETLTLMLHFGGEAGILTHHRFRFKLVQSLWKVIWQHFVKILQTLLCPFMLAYHIYEL